VTSTLPPSGSNKMQQHQSMNTLRTIFEYRIISSYGDIPWPARSPYLSACDFLPCGYLQSKVFQARPADLHNLKQRISDDINAIPPAMLLRVMGSVLNRMHQCINLHGRNLTGVIFKK
jgi:hypothetical protein